MLTDAEYQEIMRRRTILQGSIDGAERDEDNYDKMKKAASDRKAEAGASLVLYMDGYLKDAIEEYEAAHPPEEP